MQFMERAASSRLDEHGLPCAAVDVRIGCDVCAVPKTLVVWGLFDCHVDNAASDTRLLKRDIQTILADPDARVVIGGDFNDMICFSDPRYVPSGMKRQFTSSDAFADAMVEYNMQFLRPLADANRIDLYISGNHEEQFTKRHGTNVAKRTADELGVPYYSYSSLLCYTFEAPNNSKRTTRGWIHHGFGGASPVTKGMIQLTRIAEYNWFDWVMMGHIHQKTFSERVAFTDVGTFGSRGVRQVPIAACVSGTYLKNYAGTATASYAAQKGMAPAPLGAGRIYLDVKRDDDTVFVTPRVN